MANMDDQLVERLTEQEAKYMTVGPAISTMTFFRGSAEKATAALRSRLAAVVAANPWLAGTLAKGSGGLELRYPSRPSEKQLGELLNPTRRGGKDRKAPVLDSTMEYKALCQAVSGSAAEVLKGSSCIGKQEPLLALTVLPDAKRPGDTFAVVFSVSHVIVDGFTYYMLLRMLSRGGTVTALSAQRKHAIGSQSNTAMGEREHKWAYGTGTLCNIICSMMCGKRPMIESYYVDTERVEALKARTKGKEGVDFVSTNDILTSTFGVTTDARVLMMPVNFRNRLPDFTDEDAGNYEGALVFGPEDYVDPSLVRKTLLSGPPTFLRGGGGCNPRPLPGCCASTRCQISMCTSWAFPFFSQMEIEDCAHMLHMPHCDVNMIPFDAAVVYRPRAGQLAVAYFVRKLRSEDITAGCPVSKLVPSAEEGLQGVAWG